MSTVLPFGTWPSPISAQMLVQAGTSPLEVWAADGVTWWSESRPAEGGRIALLRRDPDGTVTEILPAGTNARTRVHEYGGGAWWVATAGPRVGTVFFSAWSDQRLYRVDPFGEPVALTPEPAAAHGFRYADGRLAADGSWVISVRERHADGVEAVNEIVAVPTDGSAADDPDRIVVLVDGHDFVSSPRISPDGRMLVWIGWDHPSMPWDATVLEAGTLDLSGPAPVLTDRRVLTGADLGAPDAEALMQPGWTVDGRLTVVSDRRDGWWNLHVVDVATGDLVAVHADDHEVGGPAWNFGGMAHTATDDGSLWVAYGTADGPLLRRIDPDRSTRVFPIGGVAVASLRAAGQRLVAVVGHADSGAEVVEFPLVRDEQGRSVLGDPTVLAAAKSVELPPGTISAGRHVSFPSDDGRTAHAWFYPPANAAVTGPDDERPPVVVHVHGGPTAAARPTFDLSTQYWTSRGFAVVDVDYGGSTGYGRDYRELLRDAWGVVDVQDTAAAVTYLAGQGLVDPARAVISGGSAGGYTVLLSLATTDVFRAGASHYGVGDLAALATDTHKFESRYLDRLVGPYPAAADVYTARSPLTHAHRITAPTIVLQGLEDQVVPPAQAAAIVAALRENGVPHAYLTFAGEQHGFRMAANIVAAVESELAFYGRVFGFTPAGIERDLDIVFAEKLPPAA